jgi:hypothetical protein
LSSLALEAIADILSDITVAGTKNNEGHGRRQTSVANPVQYGLRQRPSDRTSTNVQYARPRGYVNPLA